MRSLGGGGGFGGGGGGGAGEGGGKLPGRGGGLRVTAEQDSGMCGSQYFSLMSA